MRRYSITCGMILFPAALMAWQAPTRPAFEVADIRPSDPSVMKTGKGRMLPGGRIEVPGYTVKDLILFAYGVTGDRVSGGPKWFDSDRYDIVAKAPSDAKPDMLRAMLQSLLADRFQLAIHSEDRPMPAYALVVAKNPPAIQASAGDQAQCHWEELEGGLRRRICQGITLAQFAKELPFTGGIGIDLPVVDQTGLAGKYDLQFDTGLAANADSGSTIFGALLKIGLKLESRKMPLPVMVVDRVERPAGN